MLCAEKIYCQREGRPVLHQVSLRLRAGTFTAVVGPNGAGKSTLLHVLTGELPATGRLTLDSRPLADFDALALARRRAVLPQRTQVGFAFTVREVVRLGRMPFRERAHTSEAAVKAAMRQADVLRFADRPIQTLSGGEQQRVHLARVLAQIGEPAGADRYLLLDEPTASLDLAQQHHLFGAVRRVCDRGVGVLAIVHDLNLAATYADELLMLRDGRPVVYGPTREVLQRQTIEAAFGHAVRLLHDQDHPVPIVVPIPHALSVSV